MLKNHKHVIHIQCMVLDSAKSYLIFKKTSLPEQGQHNAVYQIFKRHVKNGELDKELLRIYEDAKVKAEVLLSILEDEEGKRTQYTYKTLPQANREPAEISISNAKLFISYIRRIIT